MKELPDFTLRKKYDCYYLFSDSEITNRKEFSDKLNTFISLSDSKYANIELIVPPETEYLIEKKNFKLPTNEISSLYDFYRIYVPIKNTSSIISLYGFNYHLFDNEGKWEAYSSQCSELFIVGCNEEINSLFYVLFNPYDEITLQQKYKDVTSMFRNESDKQEYIKLLELNYNFSKYDN